MQNKLQELTDKLYNEGVSKGKKEAGEIVSKAEKQAADIIAEAKRQAETIIKEAEKNAAELSSKTDSDLKMASRQAIAALKQETENSIVAKALKENISNAIDEKEFLRDLILTVAKAFNPEKAQAVPLETILPEEMKASLDTYLKEELKKNLGSGMEIRYGKLKSGGFRIGPKDGSYTIGFTGDDFEALIAEYLRPKTRELLFG